MRLAREPSPGTTTTERGVWSGNSSNDASAEGHRGSAERAREWVGPLNTKTLPPCCWLATRKQDLVHAVYCCTNLLSTAGRCLHSSLHTLYTRFVGMTPPPPGQKSLFYTPCEVLRSIFLLCSGFGVLPPHTAVWPLCATRDGTSGVSPWGSCAALKVKSFIMNMHRRQWQSELVGH